MVTNLRRWSTTATANATVAGGANTINFAEGQNPSTVNNSARELMAQVRGWYTAAEASWIEQSNTASIASQTVFKLSGDQTANWTANRRWRLRGGSTTRYGSVVSSSFTAETTITVTVDSGSLSASHSIAALASITSDHLPANTYVTSNSMSAAFAANVVYASTTETLTGTEAAKSVTPDALAALWEKGSDVASATTTAFGEGGYVHITGTTTITDLDFTTAKDGRSVKVVFDGALTLTHNATTLILPGGANITTAAGDTAEFVQDSSDNIKCLWYQRATGLALVRGTLNTVQNPYAVSSNPTASHGVTSPRNIFVYLECITTDLGYAVGDKIPLGDLSDGAANSKKPTAYFNATTVGTSNPSGLPTINHISTFAQTAITAANWKIMALVFA